MHRDAIRQIADAVLYEGYMLYPYRPSVKNRQRWTFGGLFPPACCEQDRSESPLMQAQCIVEADGTALFSAQVRFLHLMQRTAGELLAHWSGDDRDEPCFRPVDVLQHGAASYPTWQEATEREVATREASLTELTRDSQTLQFHFPAKRVLEPVAAADGAIAGVLVREQQQIEGSVDLQAEKLETGLYRVTVLVRNDTQTGPSLDITRDAAAMQALVSTHAILTISGGRFISSIDPPPEHRTAVDGCRNIGAWPVLFGDPAQQNALLCAPIILYDYPQIAPESPGDLFDGTEIEEILTLRILTLTDDEQQQATALDARTAAMLQRSQQLAREQLINLHGTFRGLSPVAAEESP